MDPAYQEDSWKYTDLGAVKAMPWQDAALSRAVEPPAPAPFPVCGRLVFHNGFLCEIATQLPPGWDYEQTIPSSVHSFSGQSVAGDAALGMGPPATLRHAVTLSVTGPLNDPAPLEILFTTDAQADLPLRIATDLALVCPPQTSLRIVERHTGKGPTLSFVTIAATLRPGGRLEHIRMEKADPQAVLLQNLFLRLEEDARYDGFYYGQGAHLCRHEVRAALEEPKAQAHIRAVNLLRGRQTGDLTTFFSHNVADTASTQSVATVLADTGKGVYQGKIAVAPGADKTDARQQSRALLLSEGVEMNTRPELEIHADDVKCSHGAAMGALDPEALFYLRSRGLPAAQARALLIRAFAAEGVEGMSSEAVREAILQDQEAWLEEAAESCPAP